MTIKSITRDGVIVVFALLSGGYEIVLGGARPSVLTFLTGLLLTPIVLSADEARKKAKDKKKEAET